MACFLRLPAYGPALPGGATRRLALLAGVALLAAPARAQQPPPPALTRQRLEQLVAPVALYPDGLLAPVLMASTDPLDVVRAERWLSQGRNSMLRGEELAAALQPQPWDPAVKALVPFPEVLRMMSRNLEWTEALGDAFRENEGDVMNAVQALRYKAREAGQLRTNEQWRVSTAPWDAPPPERPWIVEPPPEAIVIEPARPDVVPVPVYDPRVAYGGWPYPDAPPAYFPPPASYGLNPIIAGGIGFLAGTALVAGLWGLAQPRWGRGIYVEAPRWNRVAYGRPPFAGEYWRPGPRGNAWGYWRNRGYGGPGPGPRFDRGPPGYADRGPPGGAFRGGPPDRGGRDFRGGPPERGGRDSRGGPPDRGGRDFNAGRGGGQQARAVGGGPDRGGGGSPGRGGQGGGRGNGGGGGGRGR